MSSRRNENSQTPYESEKLDIEGEKAVTVLSGLHDVSDTPGHSYSNYKFRAFI